MTMIREEFPFELAPALVKDFVLAHQEYTESPDEFLAFSALYAGSVIAGRWVEFNNQFLNNYYLIVGPTGTARKTTGQALAMNLLRDVKLLNRQQQYQHIQAKEDEKPPEGPDTAYPLVTHFSIEGLQSHAIGEGTSTAIQMGEYGSLFEVGKRQSQQNTISELTNMYDGNLISVKLVSRKVTVENFALSILGGSTLSWLADFCSGRNISGGFVNRHLIITGSPTRILPRPQKPEKKVWDDIVARYSSLVPEDIYPQVIDGRIRWDAQKRCLGWSSETEVAWTRYYQKRTEEMRRIATPILVELSARETAHAIKMTGLSTFLDRRLVVSERDLLFGMRTARWSTQNLVSMVTLKGSATTEAGLRVLNKIKKSGPISKTDLAKGLGGRQKEINRAIGHLVADEVLEECPDGLLRLNPSISNSQQDEIKNFFGKLDSSEFFQKKELEVGTMNPNESTEERAAIIEYDAGYSKEDAERAATFLDFQEKEGME